MYCQFFIEAFQPTLVVFIFFPIRIYDFSGVEVILFLRMYLEVVSLLRIPFNKLISQN